MPQSTFCAVQGSWYNSCSYIESAPELSLLQYAARCMIMSKEGADPAQYHKRLRRAIIIVKVHRAHDVLLKQGQICALIAMHWRSAAGHQTVATTHPRGQLPRRVSWVHTAAPACFITQQLHPKGDSMMPVGVAMQSPTVNSCSWRHKP